MPTKQRLLACWAKLGFGHGLPEYHPLLYHMVDVSIVAREMWRSAFSPAQRTVMSEALGLGGHLEAVGLWCAFLAGLHDLGKASPAFQLQVDNIRGKVTERLHHSHMRVPVQHRLGLKATPHGTITAATMPITQSTPKATVFVGGGIVSDVGSQGPICWREIGPIGSPTATLGGANPVTSRNLGSRSRSTSDASLPSRLGGSINGKLW